MRPIGVHSPGFVAATDEAAREAVWPHYQTMFGRIGKSAAGPPVTKDRFLAEVTEGAMFVGSPETVARKIVRTVKGLGLARFDMKYSTGPMPHETLMEGIRLLWRARHPDGARDAGDQRRRLTPGEQRNLRRPVPVVARAVSIPAVLILACRYLVFVLLVMRGEFQRW